MKETIGNYEVLPSERRGFPVCVCVCVCIYRYVCIYMYVCVWASLVTQLVKNLPAVQETLVQFLGLEDSLEKG